MKTNRKVKLLLGIVFVFVILSCLVGFRTKSSKVVELSNLNNQQTISAHDSSENFVDIPTYLDEDGISSEAIDGDYKVTFVQNF